MVTDSLLVEFFQANDEDSDLDVPSQRPPPILVESSSEEEWRFKVASYWKDGNRVNTGVGLGPSTIPGAGTGVFAEFDLEAGEVVTYYDGRLISYAQAGLYTQEQTHLRRLNNDFVIDGFPLTQMPFPPPDRLVGFGSFINDHPNDAFINVEFEHAEADDATFQGYFLSPGYSHIQEMVVVRTLRDIAAGEELFVKYGDRDVPYLGYQVATGTVRRIPFKLQPAPKRRFSSPPPPAYVPSAPTSQQEVLSQQQQQQPVPAKGPGNAWFDNYMRERKRIGGSLSSNSSTSTQSQPSPVEELLQPGAGKTLSDLQRLLQNVPSTSPWKPSVPLDTIVRVNDWKKQLSQTGPQNFAAMKSPRVVRAGKNPDRVSPFADAAHQRVLDEYNRSRRASGSGFKKLPPQPAPPPPPPKPTRQQVKKVIKRVSGEDDDDDDDADWSSQNSNSQLWLGNKIKKKPPRKKKAAKPTVKRTPKYKGLGFGQNIVTPPPPPQPVVPPQQIAHAQLMYKVQTHTVSKALIQEVLERQKANAEEDFVDQLLASAPPTDPDLRIGATELDLSTDQNSQLAALDAWLFTNSVGP